MRRFNARPPSQPAEHRRGEPERADRRHRQDHAVHCPPPAPRYGARPREAASSGPRPRVLHPVGERGPAARCTRKRPATRVVAPEVLQHGDVALEARHVGDRRDPPRPVAEPRGLHDQVDGGDDLVCGSPPAASRPTPSSPGTRAGFSVSRGGVGVDREHRAGGARCSWPASASRASGPRTSPTTIRSGRILSAFFSSSRMAISPPPSADGGARLEAHHVRLQQAQFGGVLQRDHGAPRGRCPRTER